MDWFRFLVSFSSLLQWNKTWRNLFFVIHATLNSWPRSRETCLDIQSIDHQRLVWSLSKDMLLEEHGLFTGVNFINILLVHFAPIFRHKKITKPNIGREKLVNLLSNEERACKMLMKLTPAGYGFKVHK